MNEATIVSKSEFPDDITLIALRIVKNVNLTIDDKDELFLDIANAILSERDELKSKFDACLQEMSECFRAVNIAKVIRQSGNDFVLQAERMMKMQAELATVKLAAEANHNLAVANGNRAREEYDRAEDFSRQLGILLGKLARVRAEASEVVNMIHNLSCRHQHNEDLSEVLGELRSRLWALAASTADK